MKIVPLLFSVLLLASPGEVAADDVAAASEAFSRAQRAMLSGNYSRAADLFELADGLAPSPAALRSAVRARYAAGHKAAAATHAAELLRRYPDQGESRKFAEQILDELTPELGRISVRCSSPCTVEVEGKAVATAHRREHTFFVRAGEVEVVASFEKDKSATETITAVASRGASLTFEEPPDPKRAAPVTEPEKDGPDGLRPHWAIGTGVVAVGLGVTATVFGLSTLEARDDIRAKVSMGNVPAAEKAYADAKDTQLMTNVFIAGAAVAGATTVALSLFTDWSGPKSGHEVNVQPASGGGSVVYVGRF